LNHDQLTKSDLAFRIEQCSGDDEMSRARDRQEFGQALDEADDDVDDPVSHVSPVFFDRGSR
jgi:hypothetical protein